MMSAQQSSLRYFESAYTAFNAPNRRKLLRPGQVQTSILTYRRNRLTLDWFFVWTLKWTVRGEEAVQKGWVEVKRQNQIRGR